jgi:hypothetical protein
MKETYRPGENSKRQDQDFNKGYAYITYRDHFLRKGGVTWMADCVGFLEKSGREIDTAEVEGQDKNVRRRENREILEMLEYVRADALCLCGFQKSLKERGAESDQCGM